MSGDSLIEERSYAFALRVVNAYKYLTTAKGERVMSKQLLRSGTSVGAMMHEAKFAQSRADFVSKASVALKEANETQYWLRLLHDSDYIDDATFASMFDDAQQVTAILVSIVKSTKANSLKYETKILSFKVILLIFNL